MADAPITAVLGALFEGRICAECVAMKTRLPGPLVNDTLRRITAMSLAAVATAVCSDCGETRAVYWATSSR